MSHRLASNKSAGSGGTPSDFDETMPYNVDTALENVLPEPAPLPDLTPQRFADLKMLREKTLPLPGDMEVRVRHNQKLVERFQQICSFSWASLVY